MDSLTALSLKLELLDSLSEPTNRFQSQLLGFVKADVQSPACLTLQDLLVLEETQACQNGGDGISLKRYKV